MIRHFMFYFRRFRDVENTAENLHTMGHYYQNPTRETLLKIVLKDAQVKSSAALSQMYNEYFTTVKNSMDELMKYTDWISLTQSLDQ